MSSRRSVKFFAIYFVLLTVPVTVIFFPKGELLGALYFRFWRACFQRFNDLVLHWPVRQEMTGSGDSADNFFIVIAMLPIAFLLTVVLKNFEKYERWINIYLRWHLAAVLFAYGFDKIFPPGQFGTLSELRLLQPFGQSSPMGLLWTFMAASRPYTIFAGLMEVFAGVLLLWPPLATIGAMVSFGVMSNVLMLNLCYDVPVKLFAFQLVMLSLWILALDHKRLLSFVRGQPTPAAAPAFKSAWDKRIQASVATFIFGTLAYGSYAAIKDYRETVDDSPIKGLWRVISQDEGKWLRLQFKAKDSLHLQRPSGEVLHFRLRPALGTNAFEIQGAEEDRHSTVTIEHPDKNQVHVKGKINEESVDLSFGPEPAHQFPLLDRGFHLITETPYIK